VLLPRHAFCWFCIVYSCAVRKEAGKERRESIGEEAIRERKV
jgi:hypothetical protein